ncbi:hypothetical protein F5887DRAFT_1008573 [Amanita rubescens]|nr:hypothetical protein F5887DRAFT_1008573 [Amanita rubescens]
MRTIGTSHKVTRVPDDAMNHLALALRARLRGLPNTAPLHNSTALPLDTPIINQCGLSSSVQTSQNSLRRGAEREEETRIRRERKERAELAAAHAAALAAQANAAGAALGAGLAEDDEGGAKKKRRKERPGVTARNMSGDVQKKMSNAVATQAADWEDDTCG